MRSNRAAGPVPVVGVNSAMMPSSATRMSERPNVTRSDHALRLHAVQNGAANGDEEEGHDVAAHAEDDMERLRKEVGHDGPGRSPRPR